MNKDETTKSKDFSKKVEEPKETLTPKEIKEDTRDGVKEEAFPKGERVDPTKEEKFKKDEELVKKDVEEKTRVKVKPVPPSLMEKLYNTLIRIERMLEWLVVQRVTDAQKLIKQPNITDILKEIAVKMEDEKTEGGEPAKTEEEKEDEVPPTT